MPVLDANGRAIPRAVIQRVRANALSEQGGFGEAYHGAGRSNPITADWAARILSADKEWLPNRAPAVARARDTVRNDPVGASAVSRRQNAAIGRGWRLSSRPNARALGITPEVARELGTAIELEWRPFAYGHDFQCDAERRLNLGQLQRVALAHLLVDGEGLGLTEWADDEDTRYRTRLRLVDPDRLCNPIGRMDDALLRGGIERNHAQVPVRYWLREQHPADLGLSTNRWKITGWERFTEWGRPQVLHWFDAQRAGQTRGVSRFAAALKSFRALSKFTEATLQAATVNAMMVAFIKSSAGVEAISENFEVKDFQGFEGFREGFYEQNPVNLANGVRMPVMPFGDSIEMQTKSKDVTSFDAFVRSIIRLIAASLGVTYEELSMDYSQTNYSSARAAMVHAWAETVAISGIIEAQLMRPFFVAWLEEAFDQGYVVAPAGAPDFYDAIDAYADAKWIGPGRGFIDPTKEIDAARGRVELGISTLEAEAAEQGEDWEEIAEQRLYEELWEKQRREEMGLPPRGNAALDALAATARSPEHNAALAERAAA